MGSFTFGINVRKEFKVYFFFSTLTYRNIFQNEQLLPGTSEHV